MYLRSRCDRDEDGNIIDPIFYNEVPEDRVITVQVGNAVQCYDIETLD